MKTRHLSVLLALTMSFAPLVQAQDESTRGEGRRGRGGEEGRSQGRGQMMNPEARVEQLDRALQLTPEQKTKIQDIYAKTQEEMRSTMRGGRDGDQQANREKMQSLMQSTRDQVRAVLSDEQKKKFDALPQPGARGRGGRDGDRRGAGGRGKGGPGGKKG